MKYGNLTIKHLSQFEKDMLLQEVIDQCVRKAGDSYSDFARPIIKTLVRKHLVEYGGDNER